MSSRASDYYTPKSLIKELYRMMYSLHNTLLRHNIPYFIESGTLIGAVRHKGIIPWDNDCDISVNIKDIPTILKQPFKKDLKDYGYGIKNKMKSDGWLKVYKIGAKHPDIDIFPVKYKKKGNTKVLHYAESKPAGWWPKMWIKNSDVFPLKEYKLGAITVLGPKNPKPYLDRSYGKSWSKVGYITQDPDDHLDLDEPIKLKVTKFTAAKNFFKPPKSDPSIRLRKGCPLLCSWDC